MSDECGFDIRGQLGNLDRHMLLNRLKILQLERRKHNMTMLLKKACAFFLSKILF